MKILVVDREPSTDRLGVAEMCRRVQEHGMTCQIVDADSPSATNSLNIYNIVDFPAVAVIRDDGQLVALWQKILPTFDEISRRYGLVY